MWSVVLSFEDDVTVGSGIASNNMSSQQQQQQTAWKRPVSRIYHYNLEVGENYYNPMTAYIDNKIHAEAPGALSFSERLAKKWIRGRTEYKATTVSTAVTTSYTRGF